MTPTPPPPSHPNAGAERHYTIKEIADLRQAVTARWHHGTTNQANYSGHPGRVHYPEEAVRGIEELLRAEMLAGHVALDLYRADNPNLVPPATPQESGAVTPSLEDVLTKVIWDNLEYRVTSEEAKILRTELVNALTPLLAAKEAELLNTLRAQKSKEERQQDESLMQARRLQAAGARMKELEADGRRLNWLCSPNGLEWAYWETEHGNASLTRADLDSAMGEGKT